MSCCGLTPYYPSNQLCCARQITYRPPDIRSPRCCGQVSYDPSKQVTTVMLATLSGHGEHMGSGMKSCRQYTQIWGLRGPFWHGRKEYSSKIWKILEHLIHINFPPSIYSLRINRRKGRRKLRNPLKQSFSAQYLPLYLLGLLWFLSCFYFRNTPMLSWPHSATQGMLLQSQMAGCQAPSGLPACGSTTCITVVINEKCSHRHFYQKFCRVKCDFFLFGLKVSCCDGIW